MKIGFIGTGIMGGLMAQNLQNAGYELIVHNRTKDKAQMLLDNGADWGNTPADVAKEADLLITMLAHPEAVTAIAFGDDGVLDHLKPNTIWMDCSTVNPTFSRYIANESSQREIRFLDAPVAGSKAQADGAQLVFIVGGDPKDVEACQPLFDVMGSKVLHVGENGMGMSLKLVLNHLLATSMLAFAEGMALGESLGITQETLLNVLVGGPVVAPYMARKRAKITSGEYDTEFPLRWIHKDMQMVTQTAYESGVPMPIANATKELYQMAIRADLGDSDFSAIYQFVQQA